MKTFILLLAIILIVGTSRAQTNVYTAPFTAGTKTKIPCAVPNYYSSGAASYIPPQIAVSNKWYYTTTNILTISSTDQDALVYYLDNHSVEGCHRGSLTWTNNTIPSRYRFDIFLSNNVPLPPNGTLLGINTVGFRTNSP